MRHDVIDSDDYKGYRISIMLDGFQEDPRGYTDYLTTIWHLDAYRDRYNVGDKDSPTNLYKEDCYYEIFDENRITLAERHGFESEEAAERAAKSSRRQDVTMSADDDEEDGIIINTGCDEVPMREMGSMADIKKAIEASEGPIVWFDIFYHSEHGDSAIHLCGSIEDAEGVVFVTKKNQEKMGVRDEHVEEQAKAELEEVGSWANGNVYEIGIEKITYDDSDEETETDVSFDGFPVGGIYGSTNLKYMKKEAEAAIDRHIAKEDESSPPQAFGSGNAAPDVVATRSYPQATFGRSYMIKIKFAEGNSPRQDSISHIWMWNDQMDQLADDDNMDMYVQQYAYTLESWDPGTEAGSSFISSDRLWYSISGSHDEEERIEAEVQAAAQRLLRKKQTDVTMHSTYLNSIKQDGVEYQPVIEEERVPVEYWVKNGMPDDQFEALLKGYVGSFIVTWQPIRYDSDQSKLAMCELKDADGVIFVSDADKAEANTQSDDTPEMILKTELREFNDYNNGEMYVWTVEDVHGEMLHVGEDTYYGNDFEKMFTDAEMWIDANVDGTQDLYTSPANDSNMPNGEYRFTSTAQPRWMHIGHRGVIIAGVCLATAAAILYLVLRKRRVELYSSNNVNVVLDPYNGQFKDHPKMKEFRAKFKERTNAALDKVRTYGLPDPKATIHFILDDSLDADPLHSPSGGLVCRKIPFTPGKGGCDGYPIMIGSKNILDDYKGRITVNQFLEHEIMHVYMDFNMDMSNKPKWFIEGWPIAVADEADNFKEVQRNTHPDPNNKFKYKDNEIPISEYSNLIDQFEENTGKKITSD